MGPVPDTQGRIAVTSVTSPAAGAEVSAALPARTRWRLISVRTQLVTDLLAADRRIRIQVLSGTTVLWEAENRAVITAGLTRVICASPGQIYNTGGEGITVGIPIPDNLLLNNEMTIRTQTANIQVGDQYSAVVILAEEWVEPLA